MGTLLGPLLGGFLCQPAEKYGFKGPGNIFVRYPYLLPCVIGACYNVAVVALCFPCMGETNIDTRKTTKFSAEPTGPADEFVEEHTDEETPLIVPQGDISTSRDSSSRTRSLVLLIAGHALVHHISLARLRSMMTLANLPSAPLPCTPLPLTRCTQP